MKKDTYLADLLQESVEKVGRERDHEVMDAIGNMSREEFKAVLEETAKPWKRSRRR